MPVKTTPEFRFPIYDQAKRLVVAPISCPEGMTHPIFMLPYQQNGQPQPAINRRDIVLRDHNIPYDQCIEILVGPSYVTTFRIRCDDMVENAEGHLLYVAQIKSLSSFLSMLEGGILRYNIYMECCEKSRYYL